MGLLKNMSLEDKLRWQEEDRLKAISDEKAEKAWAYDQGLEKGMEKGIRKMALKMLEENIDFSIIQKITGLSETDIEKIQQEKR